ncbi:hypothetical protein [Lachnospira multipara]|uniref:ABC-2 family transporter protein n=1 Tax=Lachnospira multipara TaxID=28051 RepID=A0A1H5WL48_9FIRM|nr:hypothetical protein [Lachnospira multipara]SEG00048.1 hypothetical protein SAMN05216537_11642 [Lachnospira multipara]
MGIKFELKRSFKTPQFFMAIGLELLIVALHFVVVTVKRIVDNYSMLNDMHTIENFVDKVMFSPIDCFGAWIAMDYKFYMYIILFICPVIAAMPYATSYYTDVRGSVGKNVIVRIGKSKYLKNKLVAVFINAGVTVTIPIIIDLLVCMMFFPFHTPDAGGESDILCAYSSFSHLYYSSPLAFSIIEIIMIFIFSGIWACLALSISKYVKYRYSILLVGMIVNLFLNALSEFVGKTSISPISFMASYYTKPRFLSFVVVSVIFIIAIITDYYFIEKNGDM